MNEGETIEFEVPDELHRKLELRAASEGMSLSDFLIREFSKSVQRPPHEDLLRRRVYAANETPNTILEAVKNAKMDERHEPLNKLMDE